MTDSASLVRIDADGAGHVVEIVLDRPDALNAVSTAMAEAISDVTTRVAADPKVRCVVLRSSQDRAFCVGADLKERNGFTDADLVRQRPVARAAYRGGARPAGAGDRRGGGVRTGRRVRDGPVLRRDRGRRHRDGRAAGGLRRGHPGWWRDPAADPPGRVVARGLARLHGPAPAGPRGVGSRVRRRGRPGRDRSRPGPRARPVDRGELAGRAAPVQAGDAARLRPSTSPPGWRSRTPAGARPPSAATAPRGWRRSPSGGARCGRGR